MAKRKKITDYTPDPSNANKGTERGIYMVEQSLTETGAGRSIVVDKNGVIIAGNKTQQGAHDLGIEDVIEVETDGNTLVVVKRNDLDLMSDEDTRARRMAYFDNRANEEGLEWDAEQIFADMQGGLDLGGMFFDWELVNILGDTGKEVDYDKEWKGMPEFDNEDLSPDYTLKVNFGSLEDLQAFSELIGQSLTDKTRSIWYPEAELRRYADKEYARKP